MSTYLPTQRLCLQGTHGDPYAWLFTSGECHVYGLRILLHCILQVGCRLEQCWSSRRWQMP